MNFKEIKEIKDMIMNGYQITREEAIKLSYTNCIEALYYSANQIRDKFCGSRFELISNFNLVLGNCEEDCHWCPLSKITTINYSAYEQFDIQKVIDCTIKLHQKGVKWIELSTTHRTLTDEQLTTMIGYLNAIADNCNIGLCASFGSLSREQLIRVKTETKATRYHCNVETSERFYPKVCTTGNINDKYKTLKDAHELGFHVCSGGIIGMGETMEDRIDMALKLRELGVKSIALNILFSFNGTPFEKHPTLGNQEILTTFAIFRFINPRAQLRFARGRSLIKIIEKEALQTGINASIAGELLVTAQPMDIVNDIKLFESEGFRL